MTQTIDFASLPGLTIYRTYMDFNAIYWLKISSIATNNHFPLQSTPNRSSYAVAEKHSSSLDDEIKTIKNIAGFAGHWSIVPLSDILSAPVGALYPSEGKINAYSLSLARLYMPKLSKTMRPTLKIM